MAIGRRTIRPTDARGVRLHRTAEAAIVSYGLIGDLAEAEDAAADFDFGRDDLGDPQGFLTRALEARRGRGRRT